MNANNMNLLANAIESHAQRKRGWLDVLGFNMTAVLGYGINDHVDQCGSTGCLCGWGLALMNPDLSSEKLLDLLRSVSNGENELSVKDVREWLGLTKQQGDELFCFGWSVYQSNIARATAEQAVEVLREAVATGETAGLWEKRISKCGSPSEIKARARALRDG